MEKLLSVLVLLMLVPRANAQSAVVPAQPAQTEESRLLGLELLWNQAVQGKDTRALEILIAPEMVNIEYDGTLLNRDLYLASVTSRSVHAEHIGNESMSVHLYGQIAVVIGVYREAGTESGKPYSRRGRFTDTWVRRSGSWLCVATQSTLIAR
jgi:ketosteroid isomerase-like protein